MKRSRPLSLFLSVLFLIFLFPVVSLGASDNLISPDLTTWQDVSNLEDDVFPINVAVADNIYRVTLTDQEYSVYFGAIIDQTSLVAGHSYSLSFKMPGRTEINTAFSKSYSASVFESHFTNSELFIGIGYISPSGEVSLPESSTLYQINQDNYTKYFGKTLKASFIASSYTGTPVVIINICSLDGTDHSFYFSDFKLIDNDDNSAELTGIKGFLHSIRWDLVGGTCEEEDCPHSSGDNPHLSLSERMSSGFKSMFDDIGTSLTSLKDSFSERIGDLTINITSLGDRISGFFSGLGDRISGFFTNLSSNIGGFFNDLKTNMSNWFSELGNKITTKFQEIGDKFTEFFEKFKPVVSFNFDWKSNVWISTSNGLIYESESYYYNAAVTDFFEVPEDFVIKFDFKKHPSFNFYVFQYNENGGFVKVFAFNRDTFEYVLSPGYKYRFYYFGSKDINFNDYSDLNDFCGQYLQVYCDEGWVNALLYKAKMFVTDFFSGFGNLILYFNWDGEYTNPFEREDSPIDKVSEFFDDLIEYVDSIGTSIENILDSITGGLHIFDEFTSRFPWLKGIAMFCLAIIVLSRFIGL